MNENINMVLVFIYLVMILKNFFFKCFLKEFVDDVVFMIFLFFDRLFDFE